MTASHPTTRDSYDAVPYQSGPFAESHPDHLGVIGELFALHPAPATHCRVLELGCASGGNLLPMALALPESQFVGIDLSPRQIAAGETAIATLGISNLTLVEADLLTLDLHQPPAHLAGPYDYIIAHGLYSWVPHTVREQIMQICRRWLAPHGIAYISFNTLPGWRMRSALRDLLLLAVDRHLPPAEQVAAARRMIPLFSEHYRQLKGAAAALLHHELQQLTDSHDSYLLHEYLANDNHPLLLCEFVADAERAGLQYLGDAELHTSFPPATSTALDEWLQQCTDQIALEQRIDLLEIRYFRHALLCQHEAAVDRTIDFNLLATLHCAADLFPASNGDSDRWHTSSGQEFTIRHPASHTALAALQQAWPATIAWETLELLCDEDDAINQMSEELFSLFAHGALRLYRRPITAPPPKHRNPCTSPLARVEAARGGIATTLHHASLDLDPFARDLLLLCDGQHSITHLVAALSRAYPKRQERIEENLIRLLDLFYHHGLLI
jgi:SAM-dependent methyltransferase